MAGVRRLGKKRSAPARLALERLTIYTIQPGAATAPHAVGGARQVNEQVLTVWTKWRLDHFNAPIGSDTGQGRLIVA